MGYISDMAAKEIDEVNRNAPSIDTDSFMRAYSEITDVSEDSYPVTVIAAAIHEFSNMINEHLLEAIRMKIEEKYKED